MTIDVPSGRVVARVRRAAGAVSSVTFRNVPAYVIARGVEAAGVRVDVAYGGAIYASVAAAELGLEVVPERLGELIAAGREIKRALAGTEVARHADDRLSGIYGTILYDELGPLHQRNVTVFADGEVDRSPCGSGTSARLALLDLEPGQVLRHDSIVGTTFSGMGGRADGRGGRHRDRGDGLPHRRAPLRARPARRPRHRVRAAMSRPRRSRWTSFVADPDEPRPRILHEEENPAHRVRVEHDANTLLIHLSDEDGPGWTVIAVDRPSRRWAVAQARRQLDAATEAYARLYEER